MVQSRIREEAEQRLSAEEILAMEILLPLSSITYAAHLSPWLAWFSIKSKTLLHFSVKTTRS
jgi:hypothetical protein